MTYIEAVILGLVQGLAEFLPVSSSGHLALIQNLLGVETDKVLMFTVLLHLGTLIAVFLVFWRDIISLIKEFFLMIADLVTRKGLRLDEHPFRKLLLMIIVATIPTTIIGFLFNDFFEGIYGNIIFIGIGFIITGFMLFFAERINKNRNDISRMKFRNAIFIGIMQGIAIYPGISRSGSTLVGGLVTRLKREFAVKFAFLISIPTILGSAILEIPGAIEAGLDGIAKGTIILGILIAAISGFIAIKAMLKIVTGKKLKYFSCYVWILGIVVIILGIVKAVRV